MKPLLSVTVCYRVWRRSGRPVFHMKLGGMDFDTLAAAGVSEDQCAHFFVQVPNSP